MHACEECKLVNIWHKKCALEEKKYNYFDVTFKKDYIIKGVDG